MKISVLDIGLVLWLVGGTFGIKRVLVSVWEGRFPRSAFLLVNTVAAVAPLLAMRLNVGKYSWIGVVAGGMTLFWFALLGARVNNRKP